MSKKGRSEKTRLSFEDLEEKRAALEKYLESQGVSGVTAIVAGEDPDNPEQDAFIVRRSKYTPESAVTAVPEEFDGFPVRLGVADYEPKGAASEGPYAGAHAPKLDAALYGYGRLLPDGPSTEDSAGRTTLHDVLRPGLAISHPNITSGTLGCFVKHLPSGRIGILSNWHVLSGANGKIGDRIGQPGSMDARLGGFAQRAVASLKASILDEDGDAAVAVLDPGIEVGLSAIGSDVHIGSAREPLRDELLEKSGRSTNVTRGKVKRTGRYTIHYRGVGPVTIRGYEIVPTQEDNPHKEEISTGGDNVLFGIPSKRLRLWDCISQVKRIHALKKNTPSPVPPQKL